MSQGEWRPWKYLLYASQKIEQTIKKGNGRLIINWPPRHGKSTLISKWLPTWFLDLYPHKRVFMISYADTFAKEWGRAVRDELKYNPRAITKPRWDVSSVTEWNTTDDGAMYSTSINGAMTGRGGDLIIIDDPHKNFKEALSVTICNGIYSWYKNTLYQRKEPNATIIINQTRWTTYDLTGQVLQDGDDDWEHIRIPAIAEEGDILGREIGEVLCPDRYGLDVLEQNKKVMGLSFKAVFQQQPVALEGNIIQRKWVQKYKQLPESFDEVLQSWDATFKKTGTSKVGGLVVARKGSNFFFIDQLQEKMSFTETIRAILNMSEKHPEAIGKLIEDKANGPAILDVLKNELLGLISFNPNKYGSKEARFSAVAPMFEAGNIWVPEKSIADWGDDLIEEWVNFPNHPFRDRTDATSQVLIYFQNKSKKSNILDVNMGIIGGIKKPMWEF